MAALVQLLELTADMLEARGRQEDVFVLGELAAYEADEEGLLEDWPNVRRGKLRFDRVVFCNKEPRGGMFTYNYALAAVTLPSGRRLYLEWGDTVKFAAVAVARPDAPETADMRLVAIRGPGPVDLPFSIRGDVLFRIDVLCHEAAAGGFIAEALVDHEADWMSGRMLDRGGRRRGERTLELEQALTAGTVDKRRFVRESEQLHLAPAWYFELSEDQLAQVADLPLPSAAHDPPLRHRFRRWHQPEPGMFADLSNPLNRQHVAAAFVVGGFD